MQTTTRFPTFNWMRGVSDEKRISVIYRLILLRLCIHRDEKTGQCNPGYQTLATELGVYRTTVLKAVDSAVRYGWLGQPIRTRRANASFVFTFPPHQEVAPVATSKEDQEVAERQHQENQEVAPGELRSRSKRVKKSLAERGSPAASKTSKRNGQRERPKKNGHNIYTTPVLASAGKGGGATPELEAAFEEFWASAPSRVEGGRGSKTKARTLYVAAVKGGVPATKINAGMKAYAAARAEDDPTYTSFASSWLEHGRYDVEPTGPLTIDEQGNVIAEPPRPRRSRPPTEEELRAEILGDFVDPGKSWERRR